MCSNLQIYRIFIYVHICIFVYTHVHCFIDIVPYTLQKSNQNEFFPKLGVGDISDKQNRLEFIDRPGRSVEWIGLDKFLLNADIKVNRGHYASSHNDGS